MRFTNLALVKSAKLCTCDTMLHGPGASLLRQSMHDDSPYMMTVNK